MIVSEIMTTKPISSRARLIISPEELSYDFGPDHPLQARRLVALIDLLETSGLWQSSDERASLSLRAATIEELNLIHTSDYIAAVQRLSMPAGAGETGTDQEERKQLAFQYGFSSAPLTVSRSH